MMRLALVACALSVTACAYDVELVRAAAPDTRLRSPWELVASGATDDLHGVWGSAPDDVWAVGSAGAVLHWEGSAWVRVAVPTDANLNAVWAGRGDVVFLVGNASVDRRAVALRRDRTSWAAIPLRGEGELLSVWSGGVGDLTVVGRRFDGVLPIWHLDRDGLSPDPTSGSPINALFSVAGDAQGNVYAAGRGPMLQRRGMPVVWSPALPAPPEPLTGPLCVTPDGVIWAPGASGRMLRRTGAWSAVPLPAGFGEVRALWCNGDSELWIGGRAGRVAHWSGGLWSVDQVATPYDVAAMWGASTGEVWAVGQHGLVVRYVP